MNATTMMAEIVGEDGVYFASFPGLQSPSTVEGLVKLLRRMMSGGCLEAWLIAPGMH